MNPENDEPREMDATEDQLAELRRLGVAEAELNGLAASDAEEWIDELRSRQRDAGKVGSSDRRGTP
jgi:hypothetical protein